MERNRFYKELEFHDWLIDNNITSKDSATSYCSYVNSVNKHLQFNDELLQIKNNQSTKSYYELTLEILQILSDKEYSVRIEKAPKTIKNWNSAIRAYGEFLVINFQAEEVEIINDEITNELLLVGDHISYTKEELLDNFTFRLTTQDRFYDTIYFPISFIKKIFYKTDNKEYFDKWVKRILEDTVIHVENSEFKLSQISVLNFDDEGVKAEVQNKHYHVYTKHSNNKDKSPVETKELKRIALDHSKPMLAIMEELSSELVELQKITADIKLKLNKRKINRPVLADISKKLISEFYLDKVNIEQLKKDMDLIGKNKDLQLMCSVFNLQKKTS